MQFYRIYVKLKNGGQATGGELQAGSPPARGTELEVPLITVAQSKPGSASPAPSTTRR
jgi:hypothetical protein